MAGLAQRGFLLQALVRTVAVIVPRVLAIAAVTARSGIARSTPYRHTSSTSRDQAIFVDQATDASLLAEVGELRGEAPRERGAVHQEPFACPQPGVQQGG